MDNEPWIIWELWLVGKWLHKTEEAKKIRLAPLLLQIPKQKKTKTSWNNKLILLH